MQLTGITITRTSMASIILAVTMSLLNTAMCADNIPSFVDRYFAMLDEVKQREQGDAQAEFNLRIIGFLNAKTVITVELTLQKSESLLTLRHIYPADSLKKTEARIKTVGTKVFQDQDPFAQNARVLFRNLDLAKLVKHPFGPEQIIHYPDYYIELRAGNKSLRLGRNQFFPPYMISTYRDDEAKLPREITLSENEVMLLLLCFYSIEKSTDGNFKFFDDSWRALLDDSGRPKSNQSGSPDPFKK